jgi:uncharacterized repeat protein (TIGR01451 family)
VIANGQPSAAVRFAQSRSIRALFACLVFASAPLGLSAAEALSSTLSAVKRVYQKAGDQTIEAYVPFTKALPGDRVIYTIEYSNTGDTPATAVVITLPVPAEMTFVAGSADHPDATLTYSVDGARTYDRLENLTITDANGLARPARAEDVTALRWVRSQPLSPGSKAQLKYSAILK